MRRLALAAAIIATLTFTATNVFAGSPHFVGDISITRVDNTLTASGKEAGLGDEDQVHIVLSATALCINGGGRHPKAENKMSVASEGDFPVQNGRANFLLSVTATFSPACSPPMTVVFTDVTVTDTTNGISQSISGTF
jgi:hypothetical protein